jgi:AraC-like DNA-binding protein
VGTEIRQFDLYIWDRLVVLSIERTRSDTHRHGAMQLTLGVDAEVRCGVAGHDAVSARAVLIAANTPHWFESTGPAAVVWIEPESRECRRLAEMHLGDAPVSALDPAPLVDLQPRLDQLAARSLSDGDAQALRDGLLSGWVERVGPAPPLHPAVKRVVRHIDGLSVIKVGLPELCEIAEVSESHLMHQFKHDLGMPLRRYLLWRRLRHALASMSEGRTATDTAHHAGFHDASHMNRVFKQLLELTPSALLKLRPAMQVRLLGDGLAARA